MFHFVFLVYRAYTRAMLNLEWRWDLFNEAQSL
jgi:hypothetical protein